MLSRLLALSRYLTCVAVIGIIIASIALLFYEGLVVISTLIDMLHDGTISPKVSKLMAVGLIEAIDIFLIAIVAHIIGLGLYRLFVDPELPLPKWLKLQDLDDLKSQLVSSVIAVLAVLFLREAVGWDGQRDLLRFGGALAMVIGVLILYLVAKGKKH
ncbi:YqhA family protein [Dechloromonas sp. H13]|uniref:YqhA family protein n=1 Tax=Dechloromonas sp. H13 TaxID=2570193 RepID=UPI0012910BA0|nr:YqhA family protein [Dechloromonas sp. H13]